MSQGEPQRKTRRATTGPLVLGSRFGKYQIISVVGHGGKGIIYEALDTVLNRKVALKLVLPVAGIDPEELKREQDRFLVEARLSAVLPNHPNIVSVFEAGDMENQRYLAAELVIGKPLNEWKSGASQLQQLELLRDVAVAMAHSHKHGIIHRDLKPQNILVDADRRPHVTDFGLARKLGDKEDLADMGGGRIQGTPLYMSPEHAQGHKGVDARADVWSLGIMLYEILAGRVPFRGEKAQEVMERVVRDPLPPLPPTDLARAIGPLCVKALAKDPAKRLPGAAALADGLTSYLQAQAPGGGSKKKLLLAGAAAAVVAVGLVVVLLLSGGSGKDVEAALADADRHMNGRNWAEALRAYERALARNPEEPRALDGQKRSKSALDAQLDEEKRKSTDAIRRESDARSKEEREEFQRREDELKKRMEAARKAEEEQAAILKSQQVQAEERARAAEEAARKAKEELAKKDVAAPAVAVPAAVPLPAPTPAPGVRPAPGPAVAAAPTGLPKVLEDGVLHFEAEDFTGGDKPVAGEDYKDNSPNPPGQRGYRGVCDVDMASVPMEDGVTGMIVGIPGPGEWMRYRFEGGGLYLIEIRYGRNGGQLHFEVDGKDVTGPITLADPGRAWPVVAVGVKRKLADGPHELKLVWGATQNVWLDWFRFRKLTPAAPPEGAPLAEAVKAVRDAYRADYSKRSPADVLALARKLLDEGRKPGLDAPTRFALLAEARDLGVLWGDPAAALEAVDEMARHYLVSGPALKAAALAAATKAAKAPAVHADIAEAWLGLAEEQAEAEDYENAVASTDKAQTAAKAGHDTALAARGAAREKELVALKDEYKAVQTALKTLAEKPDDPGANLVVGNYRCFARDDWAGGLPKIAKGSDFSAAAAAKKDAESPIDPAEQAATGDRWREAAAKRSGMGKARYETRALYWYEKGVDGLAGPARLKVATAIDTISKSLHGGESLGRGMVFWVEAGRDVGENPRDLATGARGTANMVPTVTDSGVKAYQCGRGHIEYGLTDPVKAMTRTGSILSWVKLENRGGYGGILDRGEPQTDDFGLWVNQGRIGAHFNWPEIRPGQMAVSKTPLAAQRWIHIGFTWDEKMITFYLDGKEDGETPTSGMGIPQRRGNRLYVGSNLPGGPDYFTGLIGSIVMYNRPLAAGEVQQLYMGTRAKFR